MVDTPDFKALAQQIADFPLLFNNHGTEKLKLDKAKKKSAPNVSELETSTKKAWGDFERTRDVLKENLGGALVMQEPRTFEGEVMRGGGLVIKPKDANGKFIRGGDLIIPRGSTPEEIEMILRNRSQNIQ